MALVPFPGTSPRAEKAAPRDDTRPARWDHDDDDELDGASKMSFLEHLEELRKRLIYSAYSLLAGCAIAYIFIQRIFAFVMLPMQHMLPEGNKLIYTAGAEPFMLYLKIGLIAGIFFSSPLIIWQLWKFISPGLYTHEKKFAIPFVLLSTTFFVLGGLFSHYVAFPWTWKFFISFSTDYMVFLPKIDDAFTLYTKMLLGFGLVFEMPLLIFFLSYVGLVTHRSLWKFNKYAIVLSFIIGGVLTPGPDVVSQFLMATPMVVLYNLSILIAFVVTRRKEKALAAEPTA
jgi:sec-independent protein translocase protein TatC